MIELRNDLATVARPQLSHALNALNTFVHPVRCLRAKWAKQFVARQLPRKVVDD